MHVTVYETIILPVVFCGCESWCLVLTEENPESIFGQKWNETVGRWKNCILRSSITSAIRHIKLYLLRER
jgi:hypothetical protein